MIQIRVYKDKSFEDDNTVWSVQAITHLPDGRKRTIHEAACHNYESAELAAFGLLHLRNWCIVASEGGEDSELVMTVENKI